MADRTELNSGEMQEVLKTLGLQYAGTDVAQQTQGSALVTQDMDPVVKELTYGQNSHPILDEVQSTSTETGNELFEWTDKTSTGWIEGQSRSSRAAEASEITSQYNKRTDRVKYYATTWGTFDTLTELKNALPAVNQEDVSALINVKNDQSLDIWEGNSLVSPLAPNGYDYYMDNFAPARNTIDMGTAAYSALDANGFSNPLDIERAARAAGIAVSDPSIGHGATTRLYMSAAQATDLDNAKDFFTTFVQLNDGPGNTKFTGVLKGGFNNRFGANGAATALVVDRYIRDGALLKPRSTRLVPGEVQSVTTKPASVTAAVATATALEATRFTAAFYGLMTYFVAGINAQGMESTLEPITATVSAANTKITLTINQSAGAQETGYAIYRTFPGAALDANNARLIGRVAKTGAATTFIDLNKKLPGAVTAYSWDDTVPGGFLMVRHSLKWRSVDLPRTAAGLAKKPMGAFTTMGLALPYYTRAARLVNFVPRAGGFSPTLGNV